MISDQPFGIPIPSTPFSARIPVGMWDSPASHSGAITARARMESRVFSGSVTPEKPPGESMFDVSF